MVAMLVAVSFDHLQRFVAGNSFYGGKIHPGLDQVGNSRVAESVPGDFFCV